MPAAGELLVLGAVTALTVQRRDVPGQPEVEVVVGLLPLAGLVAIETGDVSAAVLAALELVDDGGRLLAMTLGAAPGRRYELRKRLINLGRGSGVVYQQGAQQQGAADGDGNKYRPKWHPRAGSFLPQFSSYSFDSVARSPW